MYHIKLLIVGNWPTTRRFNTCFSFTPTRSDCAGGANVTQLLLPLLTLTHDLVDLSSVYTARHSSLENLAYELVCWRARPALGVGAVAEPAPPHALRLRLSCLLLLLLLLLLLWDTV